MLEIGTRWNESELFPDPLTGRPVRRITTRGRINQTPTYHTSSAFSADGQFLVLASVREGTTWVIRADVSTGDLVAIWRAPGIGDRNYMHRGMAASRPDIDGRGFAGNRLCMAPKCGLAIFLCERRLLAVDIHTFEARVLVQDIGEDWISGAPCVSPDERHVALALSSAHPELRAGKRVTRPYIAFPDHKLRLVSVPMAGSGEPEVLYERQPAVGALCLLSNGWQPALLRSGRATQVLGRQRWKDAAHLALGYDHSRSAPSQTQVPRPIPGAPGMAVGRIGDGLPWIPARWGRVHWHHPQGWSHDLGTGISGGKVLRTSDAGSQASGAHPGRGFFARSITVALLRQAGGQTTEVGAHLRPRHRVGIHCGAVFAPTSRHRRFGTLAIFQQGQRWALGCVCCRDHQVASQVLV